MKDTIIQQIKDAFSNFSSDLNEIVGMITQSPQEFNPQVWSVIQAIYNILLPVGYSLIALFFIIDFLNKSTMFEYMRWENVVKSLLKLVVAKMIIENSFMLLGVIFNVTSMMISQTSTVGSVVMPGNNDITAIENTVNSMGLFEQIGFFISVSPMTLVMKIIKIAIFLIAYGRMIELYIMTAISPLPLATLSNEGLHGIAKKFLQTYVAVCLQGLIILIGCLIYGGMMAHIGQSADIWVNMRNMILISLVLLLILVKSGSWARQVTGV